MTMLQVLFDRKPWFRQKSHGYGAGLPIAWQGWVLMLSYVAAVLGLALLARDASGARVAGVIALIVLVSAIFVLIVKARTEGGWKWRWGGDA